MVKYILKRVAILLVTLWVVVTLSFPHASYAWDTLQ